ncbi:GGDEF domain-containing protein [Parapusillimonas sp. SGNA-6]|nr:GGDEF domain-containing protein [Parapusillimonas sp. SGNA-6]
MQASFREVLNDNALMPLYQPIVDLQNGQIIGYEGLIRGPVDSPLHAPLALFGVARQCGRTVELERLCRRKHVERFVELALGGKLFLNMSPEALLDLSREVDATVLHAQLRGIPSRNIVIEITESEAASSYAHLRQAAADYRDFGLQIAIDDLGEGFSSLRLWSELRPEYIKIDKYFIEGLDEDLVKQQFVRSIVDIAQQSRAKVIAEGIETVAQLQALRALDVEYGQGFLFARPASRPVSCLPPQTLRLLSAPPPGRRRPLASFAHIGDATARKILRQVPAVPHTTLTNDVYAVFQREDDLQVLAVLQDDVPIGLIHRLRMLDRLARPYHRELYGNKPCAQFIENVPLIVDHQTSLQDLSHLITEENPHHLSEGFIITEEGRFIGVGTGLDLIREITQMQIHAARYANPLTQLPGNVPINEHIESLLTSGAAFAVCYCDLDHFKPFNDLYSYRKGDEVIQIAANLLREHTDPKRDFVGHIGGDDFIIVFLSPDWHARCERVLARFSPATAHLYKEEHLAAGGYVTENRQGAPVFHGLVTLSLGVVQVSTALACSSHQLAEAAAMAKIQAKKLPGNSLFVERRALSSVDFASE